ncbi:enoyl-CoA hydratase/isomerase family protein [Mesorhizobium microcysteis]|uniref:Enoyl-CoA hydratase/isomerase family protein n=1 Tax=Neoaquamicrobium microcysteis TaxID=2682781 RepID=A0A5D4GXE8_9HYPH|nr:enoyl-CoA hydratase-related protein [Mesorhizobium microcysteis]TYR33541.1 enoyl-CoA hydratase/isomerase family protein [Mesorhizobium microcysteis]
MSERSIELDIRNGVGHVTLSQPERGNPFDDRFCAELCEISIECDENPAVRAVLIRAKGRFFSVGADLKWLGASRERLPYLLKGATSDLHMAVSRFARADAPVVVAVHALATGGSVALTAMADFALAARSAKFYAAFNAIGFVSDSSGTYFLPRRVGSRKAAEFIMLNQTWSAEEAERNGLVNRVVEDDALDDEAVKLAEHLAAGPTLTFGEMKRLFLSSTDQPLETQIELEARAIARCSRTQDSWDAIQAIMEKRPLTYQGR